MRINLIGSILGTSGYDSHCRGLANALYKINPDIKLDVPLSSNWTQLVNDAELAMIKNSHKTPDATIMIATPPNWRVALGDNCGKFIGYCIWEGNKIPAYWMEYLMDERVEQIWVPSQHTKDAILKTWDENFLMWGPGDDLKIYNNLKNKIKILPHGVDLNIFYPQND